MSSQDCELLRERILGGTDTDAAGFWERVVTWEDFFFLIATSVYTGNCDQLCLALQVRAQCLSTSVLSPAQEDVPTR